MKKKLVIIIPLLVLIIIAISILPFRNKKTDKNCASNIDLNEIYNSVSLITNDAFRLEDKEVITNYLPLDFSNIDDYLIATRNDKTDEYFVITKNLDESQLKNLKSFLKNKKKKLNGKYKSVKVHNHNKITYLVFSEDYNSIVEGVIRSYIYCN